MGMSSGGDDSGSISDINVTPLVDIMLVLVIILMVTAEFTKYKTVNIALPKIKAVAVKQEPHKVILTVKIDGRVFWGDKVMDDIELLPERLKQEKTRYSNISVILRAESKTEYHKLMDVLDSVKSAGIAKVGLAAEKK